MSQETIEENNTSETFLVSAQCSKVRTDGTFWNFQREIILEAEGFDDAEFKAMEAIWSEDNSIGVNVHTIKLTDTIIVK